MRVALVVLLALVAPIRAQDLPPVDADALMVEVDRLAGELRAEAERLIADQGAEAAIARLRAEAEADPAVAFQRLNLAVVVAALAGDAEGAVGIITDEVTACADGELPLALARHMVLIERGDAAAGVREASARDFAHQGEQAETSEAQLARFSLILTGLERLVPDSLECAASYGTIGACRAACGDLDGALGHLERALAILERIAPDSLDCAAVSSCIGHVQYERGDLEGALDYYQRALALLERLAPDSPDCAATNTNIGVLHSIRRDPNAALEHHQRALAVRQRIAPNSLDCAASYDSIGMICYGCGDLEGALEYFERALAIRERLAPDSLDCAMGHNAVGAICGARGDLERALEHHQQALAIRQRIAPDSLDCATSHHNMGATLRSHGDLERALEHFRRALVIRESLAPDSLDCANSCDSIGMVHYDRGDLERALQQFRRALGIRERLAPDSLDYAMSCNSLALIYGDRGDLNGALEYYERALAIHERLAPDSLAYATICRNVGFVHHLRGDLEAALRQYERALAIREHVAPNSLDCAASHNDIGLIRRAHGDLEGALEHFGRALAICERSAPDSPDCAQTHVSIGFVHSDRGDLEGALEHYERARAIRAEQAPQSADHATCCARAAYASAALGRDEAARGLYEEALRALETARARSAKDTEEEARRGFSGHFEWIYRSYVRFLLAQGDTARAAEVAEQMRAKGLREHLTRKAIEVGTPEEIAVAARWEELTGRLEALPGRLEQAELRGGEDLRQSLLTERETLRTGLDDLAVEARASVPRLAGILFPEREGLKALQALIDPDTVVLSYALGDEGISLVVLTADQSPVHVPLATKAEEVASLLFGDQGAEQKRQYRWAPGVADGWTAMDDACRDLWDALIEPAAEHLAGKKRVIVIPDGVLTYVPFAALPDEAGQPLISRLAVVSLPSLQTLDLLRTEAAARAAARTRDRRVAFALGDPDYPAPPAEKGTRSLPDAFERPGLSRQTLADVVGHPDAEVRRIPWTGAEAQRVGEIYGPEARLLLGVEATEAAARADAPGSAVLHLACHGLYCDQDPLASCLVLSLGDADPGDAARDGLLTTEDVMGLQLDADLVVLSACQTSVGKDSGGEGMIGLTRAFMFAGTPTVVSSLWSVPDQSTAELMVLFHANVHAGMDKAEAMRRAQLTLVHDHPEWASPWFWAPFVLWGDW